MAMGNTASLGLNLGLDKKQRAKVNAGLDDGSITARSGDSLGMHAGLGRTGRAAVQQLAVNRGGTSAMAAPPTPAPSPGLTATGSTNAAVPPAAVAGLGPQGGNNGGKAQGANASAVPADGKGGKNAGAQRGSNGAAKNPGAQQGSNGAPGVGMPATKGTEFGASLDKAYGGGNPFQMQSWYGGNPIDTAGNAAQMFLNRNLAGMGANLGTSGMGMSTAAGTATGQAMGDASSQLGAILAQQGSQNYEADANRAAQGSQFFMGNQLDRAKALSGAGSGVTALGQGEQTPPMLNALIQYITGMSSTGGTSGFNQSGASGWWT